MLKLFKRKQKNPENSGYSLLEFAMVVPPMLLFVMGAIDVTRILQAKQALQQGVETTLRCMYPVNGECADIQPDTSTAYLNWYRARTPIGWLGTYHSYSATANTIQPPAALITEYTARVFGPVTFDYTTHNLHASRAYYRATANVTPGYLQLADGPVANVTDSANVLFRYARQKDKRYEAASVQFLRNRNLSLTINGEETDSGSVTFVVESPLKGLDGSLPCKKSTDFNVKEPGTPRKATGEDCVDRIDQEVPFVVWIKAHGSAGGEQAATEISDFTNLSVQDKKDKPLTDIGGRTFSGSGGNASFVPRGLGADDALSDGGYVEVAKYSTIRGKFGDKLKLTFELKRPENSAGATGQASWQLDDIVVYAPHYQAMEPYTLECSGNALRSDMNSPEKLYSLCGLPSNISPEQVTIDVHVDEPPVAYDNEVVAGKSDRAYPLLKGAKIDCSLIPHGTVCDDYFPTKLSKESQSIQLDCPENNYGKNASKECPINRDQIVASGHERIGAITNIQWTKVDKVIPVTPIKMVARDCSSLNFESNLPAPPDEVKDYAEKWPSNIEYTTFSEDLIPVTMEDVTAFRNEHGYNCPEFTSGELLTLDQNTPDLKESSFFKGYHYDLGCDWEESVREKAQSEKDKNGKRILRGGYAHVLEADSVEQRISSLPQNSCSEFRHTGIASTELQIGDMDRITPVALPASVVPDECSEQGVVCKSELDRIESEDAHDLEFLGTEAMQAGLNEMRVAYPSFGTGAGCKENCADIEVGDMDNQGYIPVTARMTIPLYTLLGKSIPLSHSDTERWEGAFAK